jgi:hypothetical protein
MKSKNQVENLHEIRTLSIAMQNDIHKTCNKISEITKQLDVKQKEIKAISSKIKSVEKNKEKEKEKEKHHDHNNHNNHNHDEIKHDIEKIEEKSKKLEKAMKEEKLEVHKIMQEILDKHPIFIKAMAIYDKKFAKENKANLKNLLIALNNHLKRDMKLAYFKDAYASFITYVLGAVKTMSPAELKNSQETAKKLVEKHWKEYLEKAKKEFQKKKEKKEDSKDKEENKSKKKKIR